MREEKRKEERGKERNESNNNNVSLFAHPECFKHLHMSQTPACFSMLAATYNYVPSQPTLIFAFFVCANTNNSPFVPSKQTSKQASKQTSKQANKQTSKQANKQRNPSLQAHNHGMLSGVRMKMCVCVCECTQPPSSPLGLCCSCAVPSVTIFFFFFFFFFFLGGFRT